MSISKLSYPRIKKELQTLETEVSHLESKKKAETHVSLTKVGKLITKQQQLTADIQKLEKNSKDKLNTRLQGVQNRLFSVSTRKNYIGELPLELLCKIFSYCLDNRAEYRRVKQVYNPGLKQVCKGWNNIITGEIFHRKHLIRDDLLIATLTHEGKQISTLCQFLSYWGKQVQVESGLLKKDPPYYSTHVLDEDNIQMFIPREKVINISTISTPADIEGMSTLIHTANHILGSVYTGGSPYKMSGRALTRMQELKESLEKLCKEEATKSYPVSKLASTYLYIMMELRWGLDYAHTIIGNMNHSTTVTYGGEEITGTLKELDAFIFAPLEKKLLNRLNRLSEHLLQVEAEKEQQPEEKKLAITQADKSEEALSSEKEEESSEEEPLKRKHSRNSALEEGSSSTSLKQPTSTEQSKKETSSKIIKAEKAPTAKPRLKVKGARVIPPRESRKKAATTIKKQKAPEASATKKQSSLEGSKITPLQKSTPPLKADTTRGKEQTKTEELSRNVLKFLKSIKTEDTIKSKSNSKKINHQHKKVSRKKRKEIVESSSSSSSSSSLSSSSSSD